MALVLNTGSAYYSHITKAWPFKEASGSPLEVLSSTPATLVGGASWTNEASGWGITLVGGSGKIALGTTAALLPATRDCTILFRGRFKTVVNSDGNLNYRFADSDGGAAHTVRMLIYSGTTYSDWGEFLGQPGLGLGAYPTTLETFILRVNGSGNRVWRNGTDIGNSADTSALTVDGATTLNIGYGPFEGGGADQFIDLFVIFDGSLSDAQCAALSADPWGELFVSTDLSGTAEIDVSATGTFEVVLADIAGTAEIDVSASGTISIAPVDIAGTAEIDVGASGKAQFPPTFLVQFVVAATVRSPLVVQFDVVGEPSSPTPLLVEFDVIESGGSPLEVTFDVLDEIVALRTTKDVQAPVVEVTLS